MGDFDFSILHTYPWYLQKVALKFLSKEFVAHRVKGLTKIHREHPHCLTLGIKKKAKADGTTRTVIQKATLDRSEFIIKNEF